MEAGGQHLRASATVAGREVTVLLGGELDVAGGGVLRPFVRDVVADGPETVILDMAGLGFVDSSGLRALLEVAQTIRRAGMGLITRAPRGSDVRALIQLTGTEHLLRLQP